MGWRRAVTAHVVVAWRSPRDAVAAALTAEQIPAAVGPTESGWTRARLLVHGNEVLEPRGRDLLDLLDDLARTLGSTAAACLVEEWGGRQIVVVVPGQSVASARIPGVAAGEHPSRADWSQVLRLLDNLAALEPVLTAASLPAPVPKKQWPAAAMSDRRHRAVAHAAGLPASLFDPEAVAGGGIERELVLARDVAPPDLDVVAGSLGLPLQAVRLGATTAVTSVPVEGRQITPVAVSLASGRRAALLLWRQGAARGYQLVRRGDVLDAHVWDSGWDVVELDPEIEPDFRAELFSALAPAQGDAELLVQHVAEGDVDLVTLRALLRRAPDGAVLQRLCELLDVDGRVAEVVEGSLELDSLPGVQRVEPGSTTAAIWAAARAPRESDGWLIRASRTKPWWWRLADLLWVLVAVALVVNLWPGGGVVARAGAVLIALSAVWSLYDAVIPAATPQPGVAPGSAADEA